MSSWRRVSSAWRRSLFKDFNGTASSAKTVQLVWEISAKPPAIKIFSTSTALLTDDFNHARRTDITKAMCPARTPTSPLFTRNTNLKKPVPRSICSGDTNSKLKERVIHDYAASAAIFGFFNHLIDITDHVERRFRNMIQFTVTDHAETFDGFFQRCKHPESQ